MSKIMNDNFKINVGNPIDAKYLDSTNQPYASSSAVNAALPQSQRYVGLTVNVDNVEYWYCGGVLDTNLVIKDSGVANSGLTTAGEGLSKQGTTVNLGGELTENAVFSGSSSATLKYNDDYRSGYDQYSIPDAGFVTGLTSNSVISATNGITKTNQSIELGGTEPLTKTTSICGADNNLNLGTSASKLGAFNVNAGTASICASGSTDICSDGTITFDGNSVCLLTSAKFDADYSGGYTSLSVPDVGYVTGLTNAIETTMLTGACNGLGTSGQNVTLGGDLSSNSAVFLCNNRFSICEDFTTCPTCNGQASYWFDTAWWQFYYSKSGATGLWCDSWQLGAPNQYESTITVGDESTYYFQDRNHLISSVQPSNSSIWTQFNVTSTGIALGCRNNATVFDNMKFCVGLSGACYGGDYHVGNETNPRWIPDAAWVTGKTGTILTSAVTGATEGLTLSGQEVCLGGTISDGNKFVYVNSGSSLNFFGSGATRMRYNEANGAANCFSQIAVMKPNDGDVTVYMQTNASGGTRRLSVADFQPIHITDSIDEVGMEYDADYSVNGGVNPRWIPDASWVTGKTSLALTDSSNGLSDSNGTVCLGGDLTADTCINLNNGNCFRICDATLNGANYVFDATGVTLNNCASRFQISNNGDGYVLNHCSGSNVSLSSSGFTYGGDYRTCFTDNSLVTKCYVDNAAGAISAGNGLCRSGDTIVLGGALTANTTISCNSHDACLLIETPFYGCDTHLLKMHNSPNITGHSEGRFYYKNCQLNFDREVDGVSTQVGEELVVRVENSTGQLIPNGSAVYICGTSGTLPLIAMGNNSTNETGQCVIGVTTHDIPDNGEGYVTTEGAVGGLNTVGYSAGDLIFLDSVDGGWTNTEPVYPKVKVSLGRVIHVGAVDGVIRVNPVLIPPYAEYGDFTGFTSTTTTTLGKKLNITTFSAYTGTTYETITGITEITDIALTGATNGLSTVTGSPRRVCLGGGLLNDTQICGTKKLCLGDLNGISLSTENTNDITVNAKSNGGVYLRSQSGNVDSGTDFSNSVGIAMDYNASPAMLIYDNRPTPTGIQYAADYSNNFCDNSLITKYYVDSVATGLNVHGAVALATTEADGNQPLSGLTGIIDGIPVSGITNNRILVKNQTNGADNGIYSASTGIWGRTDDYNFEPSSEITNGDLIPVTSGNTNANSQWILVSPNPVDSGDTLTFSLFAQQQGIIEGNGICVTTSGSNREVSIKRSETNSGLCFDGAGLEIDYTIFNSGLTASNGVVSVNANKSSITGSEIDVYLNSTCRLIVDSNDFQTITAGNGVCLNGSNVELGGDLTTGVTIGGVSQYGICFDSLTSFDLNFNNASTITDTRISPAGLEYAGDYSDTFNDNSLVTKYYVNDSLTGTSILTASNGLTKSAGTICFGSSTGMGADAGLIRCDSRICIKSTGVELQNDCNCARINDNDIVLRSCNSSAGQSCDTSITLTTGGTMSLCASNETQGLTIYSPAHGAVYGGDYENDFSPRSLVTCRYVASQVSGITANGITGATNGITCCSTDNKVYLGGALTKDTIINSTAHTLTTTAVNNSFLSLYGASAVYANVMCGNFGNHAELCLNGPVGTVYLCGENTGGTNSYLDVHPDAICMTSHEEGFLGDMTIVIDGNGLAICDDSSELGAYYAADYSTNGKTCARWIPDNEYVTGLTSQGITGATVGLTLSGQDVKLGGDLENCQLNFTNFNKFNFNYDNPVTSANTCIYLENSFRQNWYEREGYYVYDETTIANNSNSWWTAQAYCLGSYKGSWVLAHVDCFHTHYCDNTGSAGTCLLASCIVDEINENAVVTTNACGQFYETSYSSTAGTNPRWIPDAEWVTGKTNAVAGSVVTGGTNGLSLSGQNLKLGGEVTEFTATHVSGTTSSLYYVSPKGHVQLSSGGGTAGQFQVVQGSKTFDRCAYLYVTGGNGSITMCSTDTGGTYNSYMDIDNTSISLSYYDDTCGDEAKLYIDEKGICLYDGASSVGAFYADDYSANGETCARWIPDAAWVTGQTGAIGAGNGLCRSGDKIVLGGALTGNTVISGNSNILDLGGSVSGLTGLEVHTNCLFVSDVDSNTYLELEHNAHNPSFNVYVNDTETGDRYGGTYITTCNGAVGTAAWGSYVNNEFGDASIYVANNNNGGAGFNVKAQNSGITYCQVAYIHSTGLLNQYYCQFMEDSNDSSRNTIFAMDYKNRMFRFDINNNNILNIYSGGTARYDVNNTGLTLTNDYDLVHKLYVDDAITGATNSYENGITESGQTVKLGGDLTADTTIGGAFTLGLHNTGLDVTGTLNVTGNTDFSGTLSVGGELTLTTVNAGNSENDSVLTIDGSGVVKKIAANTLGEDNNIYGMSIITSDTILTTGSTYVQLVNAPSSGVTVTLPANPLNGQVFRIKDAAGTALNYPVTIDRNGKLIDGGTNNGVLNTDGGALEIVYNDALGSWFVFSFVN